MSDKDKQTAAVYVSWTTFKNTLDALAENTLPNVIDRSAFAGQSGSVQGQLISGFRFLGLTDNDGVPTKLLEQVAVPDSDVRKAGIRAMLESRYSELFALNLERATPNQVLDTIGESYGVSGETKRKAARFFVSAAKYSEVPLSDLLENAKFGTRRRQRKKADQPAKNAANGNGKPAAPPQLSSSRMSKTITLSSGGALTISADIDAFAISVDDRAFVFGLIDRISEYEAGLDDEDLEVVERGVD